MKHYGDITNIDGSCVPIVDIITGGSPCQDLSVAGRRKGLAGERSGLFMEQVRVIKEMRNECIRQLQLRGAAYSGRDVRPRFMVWENVIGAFSSNKGEDFRCVLEETARIADENTTIPRPEKGKWTGSGCIVGDGWSIAWRVHDAQFWGVPQRRKRIALVADFGGHAAPEVLFERKSLFGDSSEGEEERKEIAGTVGTDADKAGRIGVDVFNQEITGEVAATVTAACGGTNTSGCKVIDRQTDRQILLSGCSLHRKWPDEQHFNETHSKQFRHDERPSEDHTENVIYDARGNGNGKICCTITGDHQSTISDYTAIVVEGKRWHTD